MRAIAIFTGALVALALHGSTARADQHDCELWGREASACHFGDNNVVLVFDNAGAPACQPTSVPDDYTFEVCVDGSPDAFSVVVTPGDAVTAIIRPDNTPSSVSTKSTSPQFVKKVGPFEDTADVTLAVSRKAPPAPPPPAAPAAPPAPPPPAAPAAPPTAPTPPAPGDGGGSGELTWDTKGVAGAKPAEGGAAASTKIKLLHHYPINIGMGVLVGRGSTTYSVANKEIQSDATAADVSYDVLFQTYPFSFYKSATGHHFGRVFDRRYESQRDYVSVIGGFSVSNPTTSLFLGIGYEPFVGMSIVAGWQPRRLPELKPGFAVGQPSGDSSVPTNSEWSLCSFAVGISLDASIAKTIVAALAK